MTHNDEPIEGPVVVAGHTWNIGDRVYFPCYSMGSITALYRAPYAAEDWQICATALCDDGEVRTCNLRLQGQFLGYGDYVGGYLASSLAEREEYYKNKPKHAMPYEVMLMARKKRIEEGRATDLDDYARSDYRQSVTSARKISQPAKPAALESVTHIRRSVVTLDNKGEVIPDYPTYLAPAGKKWCKCESCKKWFSSARYHTKTCSAKCRKALSRSTANAD